MAILRLEDGTIHTHLNDIALELAPLHIKLQHCPLNKNLELSNLLEQDLLNVTEKGQVLRTVSSQLETVEKTFGYRWYDLMVLHPGIPHLYPLMSQCDRCHTHTDNEALYILTGGCIFGFIRPDLSQVELLVEPGEYINVPAGVEHWFSPTASLQIKAIRYFMNVDSWIPNYTNTEISFHPTINQQYRNC